MDILHDDKLGENLLYGLDVVFVKLVARIVNYPLFIRRAKALTRRTSNNYINRLLNIIIDVVDNTSDIRFEDFVGRELRMVVFICSDAYFLKIVGERYSKTGTNKAIAKPTGASKEVNEVGFVLLQFFILKLFSL